MINPFLANVIVYLIAFIVIGVFLKIRPTYRQNILYILGNIKLLYKNYVHWSISKFIIYVYGWILASIASIPFVALLVYFLYKTAGIIKPEWINTYINESKIDYGVVTALLQHPFLMTFAILSLLVIFLIFIFSFMYAYFLQQKIYINYLVGKKLPYFTRSFLDWKTMQKYFGIIFWVSMYLLIPIGIAFFYLLLLLGLSKFEVMRSIIFSENLAVGIFQLIIFISIFVYFIYIGIRLSFAYICYLYTTDSSRTSYSYVQESLVVTRGKVWKIVGLGVPFFLISIILDNVFNFLEGINNYMPFVMNFIDFFIFSGMSLMIFISLYRVIIGKTVNISSVDEELIVEKYSKPAEIVPEITEEIKQKKTIINKETTKTPKKPATKTKKVTAKKPDKDIDINNL